MRDIFRSSLNAMLIEPVTPALLEAAEDNIWPASLWRTIEDAGFTHALAVDDGPGWSDVFVIAEAMGRSLAPVPLLESIAANWLLYQCGMPPLDGPVTICDASSLALANGAVSGQVANVPWGRTAHHLVAVIDGSTPRVVVLRTVDAQIVQGRSIGREPRDALSFSNATPYIEAELPGHLPPHILQLTGALMRAGQIAGAVRRVLDDTVAYALDRKQFGRAIASFQAVQQQMAVLAEHAAAASISADAAFTTMDARLSEFMIGSAKIVTSEAAGHGASISHAVHGAIGFAFEHRLHFATRRLWTWRNEFGGVAYWSARLGEQIVSAPGCSVWERVANETTSRRPGIQGGNNASGLS